MGYYIGTISALAVGVFLLLTAGWRRWAPPLIVILVVGAVLRGLILLVVWHHANQPLDFIHDFQVTGNSVLQHKDPFAQHLNRFGYPTWNYLPLMAYVFAAEEWLVHHLGIQWAILGRLLPIAADLAVAVMVVHLAPSDGRLRGFQYACNPIALLVSSVHGQMEPIALAFAVGGFLAARARKPIIAGALLGLAVATKSWPVILVPGMLFLLRSWRERLTVAVSSGAIVLAFFFTMPIFLNTSLVHDAKAILGYRSIPGQFGWTGIGGALVSHARFVALSPTWNHIGTLLTVGVMLGALFVWRKAEGEDVAAAMVIGLLVVTAGFGMQYLAWPLPFIVARPTKFTQPLIVGAGTFAAVGYIYLGNLKGPGYFTAFRASMFASAFVVLLLITAMPWSRRTASRERDDITLAVEGAYA